MESKNSEMEVTHDFTPFIRVYKDGRIERLVQAPFIPASDHPDAAVRSKDIVITPEPYVAARLYLPQTATQNSKLPLIIYFHGGAFVIESAFSSFYHTYVTSLAVNTNAVIISVEYRLAPENPIPACYNDAWTAIEWVAQHSSGNGPESWLNNHADFKRIFLAGDSAGANISHNMMMKLGKTELRSKSNFNCIGMVLIHPFFGGKNRDKLWEYTCPDNTGLDDPRLNPAANPDQFAVMGQVKILICTAEKDFLRNRGRYYYESLKNSVWGGTVDIVETPGEEHVFHLFHPSCENAGALMKLVSSFINNTENKNASSSDRQTKPSSLL